jgi:hypothetical protein
MTKLFGPLQCAFVRGKVELEARSQLLEKFKTEHKGSPSPLHDGCNPMRWVKGAIHALTWCCTVCAHDACSVASTMIPPHRILMVVMMGLANADMPVEGSRRTPIHTVK